METRSQVDLAANLFLRSMQALEDATLLCRQRAQHLWCIATHAHKADRGFGVAGGNGLEENVDGITLRAEPGGCVVSITTVLAVVDNDHDRFENHLGCLDGVEDAACRSFVGELMRE